MSLVTLAGGPHHGSRCELPDDADRLTLERLDNDGRVMRSATYYRMPGSHVWQWTEEDT